MSDPVVAGASGDTEPAHAAAGAELAVIVPTFNERDNLAPLLTRLDAALGGIEWEVVFVDDDSPDGTRRGDQASRPDRSRASAVSTASGGAGCPRPSSKACWRAARPIWR